MADRVGQQFGNYRLLRLLGTGTFASVYLGEHQYLERPAAVKVLHVHMEQKGHEAFLREARTIARLNHPHIVHILDFGIEDQTPYLVIEYLPNGTLRTRHPKGTILSLEQVASYVKQIASALDDAHKHHVIHRDVKPENLLLNAEGEVVLTDFGIAVVQDTLASLSKEKMAGTPIYMAPEQIQGQACEASDQYSLGVIVYEWLCGEPPFHGPFVTILTQHLHQMPPSLCQRRPDLLPAVEDAVFGTLVKDPKLRFVTVEDFATSLGEACFRTQPLSTYPPIEIGTSEHKVQPGRPAVPLASGQDPAPSLQPPMPSSTLLSPMPSQLISQHPLPLSVVSISAPPDRSYLELWEAQLRPLAQAGVLTEWSDLHITSGADRQQQINEHLSHADLIVLFVSANFFSSNECMALMGHALQRQQSGRADVVPLLLHPIPPDATPLASLSCIPSNGLPITSWLDRDAAFDLCVRDLRHLLGYPQRLTHRVPPTSLPQRYRHILLRKVRTFWIKGMLDHSLHGAALLALGLQTQPDAVANPWHLILQQPETQPLSLPAGTRITQVYDTADQELLILGAPGAGKTTLLLELARNLLDRAENNEQHPMPAVFNLSSWATKRQRLADWLAEELTSRYLVSPKLAQTFIETDQILPLLDGLDEMAVEQRTACIDAINAYRLEHSLQPLVVCCRSADYLAQTGRLRLGYAVMVQPLEPQQVMGYLSTAGSQLAGLHMALQHDPDLQALATTPLMLNILVLAYQGIPLNQIAPLGTLPTKQQQIFATYVQRMLTQRKATTRYTPDQTLSWLSFLARGMKERNQTVFYIEHMQPDWLVDKRMQRKYDWLAVHLPYILIGILVSLSPSLLFFQAKWLPFLPELILLGGLLGWLLGTGSTTQQSLVGNEGKTRDRPWYRPLQQLGLVVLLGSGMGLSLWLSTHNPLIGLGTWLSFAVCFLLLILLLRKRSTPQTLAQRRPQQRLIRRKVILNTLLVGLLAGLSTASVFILQNKLPSAVYYGLVFLVPGGLSGGILSALLIGKPATIQTSDRLIWTWQSLGRSLFSKRHMISSLLIIVIGLPLFSTLLWLLKYTVVDILLLALLSGSVIGVCYWLVLGFFRGVESRTIQDQLRVVPNQGIHDSALNALKYGLVVTILAGLGGILLREAGAHRLIIGLSIGLGVGLTTGLFNGGLACLRHYTLRILLRRSGAIPWNYPHFLDEAAARILLVKIGGGYIFLHRLLLDYLALLP